MYDSWNTICALAFAVDKIDVPKSIGNPMETGLFVTSVGKIRGQIRDYRGSIDNSNLGIHIVEFLTHYEVHIDHFDPYKKPLEHLIIDSPDTILKIPILLGLIKKK